MRSLASIQSEPTMHPWGRGAYFVAVVAACIHVATARSNATAFRIAGVATLLKANGDGKASGGYPDTTDPAEVSDGSLAQAPNRCV